MPDTSTQQNPTPTPYSVRATLRWVSLAMLCTCLSLTGCAAFHPLKGVPVKALDQEQKGVSRAGKETIDLSQLRRQPKNEYLLDSGDVLAVYVENAFPRRETTVPPTYFPQLIDVPPSFGYPVPVREDGTITLPLINKVLVRGLTDAQVEDKIRHLYTNTKLLKDHLNIMVTLQRARTYQVMVIRQESQTVQFTPTGMGGQINPGFQKRGTGQVVNLVAGKNDVLHALALTGGLPGLDAENVIYVLRSPTKKKIVDPTAPSIPYQQPQPVMGMFRGHSSLNNTIRAQSPDSSNERMLRERYGYSTAQPTTPLQSDAFRDENLFPAGATIPKPNRNGFESYPPTNFPPSNFPPGTDNWDQPLNRSPNGNTYLPSGTIPDPDLHPDWHLLKNAPASKAELLKFMPPETQVIRIPVRLDPNEELDFKEDDITLHDGDIVFIESRDTEIFYTGGLLGGGQYTLPRDYDMDVLGAVSVASGRLISNMNGGGFGNRIGGISALNQDISVSASTIIILRTLPDGGQIPIKVNLYKAMKDPAERILIQPGDYVILRYTPIEAIAAFVERNLLAGSFIGLAAAQAKGGAN